MGNVARKCQPSGMSRQARRIRKTLVLSPASYSTMTSRLLDHRSRHAVAEGGTGICARGDSLVVWEFLAVTDTPLSPTDDLGTHWVVDARDATKLRPCSQPPTGSLTARPSRE
jgi:hypothetical protein